MQISGDDPPVLNPSVCISFISQGAFCWGVFPVMDYLGVYETPK